MYKRFAPFLETRVAWVDIAEVVGPSYAMCWCSRDGMVVRCLYLDSGLFDHLYA